MTVRVRAFILVADHLKYARQKATTSQNDRAIHYWVTKEESKELWVEISRANEVGESAWPLLSRIVATEYESQIVLSSEVPSLRPK